MGSGISRFNESGGGFIPYREAVRKFMIKFISHVAEVACLFRYTKIDKITFLKQENQHE
jgi:hypothetical protein